MTTAVEDTDLELQAETLVGVQVECWSCGELNPFVRAVGFDDIQFYRKVEDFPQWPRCLFEASLLSSYTNDWRELSEMICRFCWAELDDDCLETIDQ